MLFYNKLFYSIMAEIAYTVVVGYRKVQRRVFRPVTCINNHGTKKTLSGATPDVIESMVTENATAGVDYTKEGEFPEKITYQIFNNHPNKMAFDELYDAEDMDLGIGNPSTLNGFGGSRRRRPSRKYKKSKRVLRRKSRSTRRR